MNESEPIKNYTRVLARVNAIEDPKERRAAKLKLRSASLAEPIEVLHIYAKWSRQWNVRAECFIVEGNHPYRGSAGGGNYDKLSAAVQQALDKSSEWIRFIVENIDRIQKMDHSISSRLRWVHGLPYYHFSGAGIEVLQALLQALNFTYTHTSSDRSDEIRALAPDPE